MTRAARAVGCWAVLAIAGVAVVETLVGLIGPLRAPQSSELKAASLALRAEFDRRDLIAVAPSWFDPVVRAELGDLMPIAMLGRPDGRRYPRIFEIGLRGMRHEDTQGLVADWQRSFGALVLRRYSQPSVAVTYDFVEHYVDAKVLQHVQSPTSAAVQPGAELDALPVSAAPCLFQGPLPSACPPPHGTAGAFVCPQGRVEKRTLEIAYRPRYGIAIAVASGQVTQLSWDAIPGDAWRGATLHLWLGLHDYFARKNAIGPAQISIDVDEGALRQTFSVDPATGERQLHHAEIVLPSTAFGQPERTIHSLKVGASAQSAAHHYVGFIAELRR